MEGTIPTVPVPAHSSSTSDVYWTVVAQKLDALSPPYRAQAKSEMEEVLRKFCILELQRTQPISAQHRVLPTMVGTSSRRPFRPAGGGRSEDLHCHTDRYDRHRRADNDDMTRCADATEAAVPAMLPTILLLSILAFICFVLKLQFSTDFSRL